MLGGRRRILGDDRQITVGSTPEPTGIIGAGHQILPSLSGAASVGQSTSQLRADPGQRIRLSDFRAVPVAQVKVRHDESRERLQELRDMLDGLHGIDAPDVASAANTQPAPFTEEDLQLLRSVVDSAIELHRPVAIPDQIRDALSAIGRYLEELKELLEKAGETAEATEQLAKKVGAAAIAIAGLVAILRSILS